MQVLGCRRVRSIVAAALVAAPVIGSGAAPSSGGATPAVDFQREVRPLLETRCFRCHGSEQAKGGLRLDGREHVLRGGDNGPVLQPGHSAESRLIRAVSGVDPDFRMPPPGKGEALTPQEVEVLRAWIDAGAAWAGDATAPARGHWAYQPPRRPDLPDVRRRGWVRNPIDAFVLARLEREGLRPSGAADRRTLIRRVSLDLTGLPPSVEEVEAFVRDKRPEAYERVVDRLLASVHYGERWGRFWLDLARYADTNGYEADNRRSIWPYRDWVIGALNRDLPFDAFTLEQLAGDLLPGATRDQAVATGFHRNTMVNTEGGTDDEEFRVAAVVDRVNTTFTVWMGTTLSCAQCHNHKYDPFTQTEYYQAFAFFNQTQDGGKENAPELPLPSPEQAAQLAAVRARIEPLQRVLDTTTPALEAAQSAWEQEMQGHRRALDESWQVLEAREIRATGGAVLEREADGSLRLVSPAPETCEYEVTLGEAPAGITALRVEALLDARLPMGSSGTSLDGEFVLTDVRAEFRPLAAAAPQPWVPPVLGAWHSLGPFRTNTASAAFATAFIDEAGPDLDRTHQAGALRWRERPEFRDGEVQTLEGELAATYLYRTVTVSEPRSLLVSLGSDDGLQVWVNGARVLSKDVARGVAPDQDLVELPLVAGANRLLLKVSNGSGGYGFYFAVPEEQQRYPRLEFDQAYADYAEEKFEVSKAIDTDPKTGWAIGADQASNRVNRAAVFVAKNAGSPAAGERLFVRLRQASNRPRHLLGRVRLAVSTASGEAHRAWGKVPAHVRAWLAVPEEERGEAARGALARYYRSMAPALDPVRAEIAALRKEEPKDVPTTLVMAAVAAPRTTWFLKRGNHLNRGPEVEPAVPAVLHPWPDGAPKDRLGFARWLVSPQNPLVGRVTINRIWAQYFGRGLVETSEDFGLQGEAPTHPELLDWLACEFVEPTVGRTPGGGGAWSLKRLHRLLVTSATYRQAARVTPALLERDPFNRLYARGPRFRMEAEMVRDTALAASGLLNPHVGGPSVFPYQPEGVWAMPYNGDTWQMNTNGHQFRRGVYTFWRRSAPYAAFQTFDAPSREVCTERRPRTNTPLQALTTLNDPAFLVAAGALAQRVTAGGEAEDRERLVQACLRCWSRPPTRGEARVLRTLAEGARTRFAANPEAAAALLKSALVPVPASGADAAELAVWTVVANALLNLDETLTKG